MTNVECNGHCTYEFILMDCNMPVMDGYEATQKIREYLFKKDLHQPIITAVTGHIEHTYVRKAFSSGMNQVVSKPIGNDVLKETLV